MLDNTSSLTKSVGSKGKRALTVPPASSNEACRTGKLSSSEEEHAPANNETTTKTTRTTLLENMDETYRTFLLESI